MVFGMSRDRPASFRLAVPALAAAVLIAAVPAARASSSGGAGFAAINSSSTTKSAAKVPPPPSKKSHGSWLTRTTITEYWPSPESWFSGKLVSAPGLPGKYPIDWLYSATGISMEGEGISTSGQMIHIDSLGSDGWVTAAGKPTDPRRGWSGGAPFWRAGGYWLGPRGAVTYPLAAGGWFNGKGKRYVPLHGVTFAAGPSLPLKFLQSIAVDPKVIPLGSRVYIPAYKNDGYGGWFVAQDTGGGILGHHVDVYRRPPSNSSASGGYLTSQRIYVIKPSK
jgi:3D (Asp-Asp-Asp) domain-containing protein